MAVPGQVAQKAAPWKPVSWMKMPKGPVADLRSQALSVVLVLSVQPRMPRSADDRVPIPGPASRAKRQAESGRQPLEEQACTCPVCGCAPDGFRQADT